MKFSNILKLTPPKIIVFGFLIFVLFGGLLLTLPIASRDGNPANFVNALFTATSAACVTGLVVLDTLTYWSTFGQIVILLLIQIGGIGIITLATFFLMLIGKKLKLKSMLLAQEQINHFSFTGALKIIRSIVLFTVSAEFIGAFLLSLDFVPRFGLVGIYKAVFTAVSAFCNAGFDLMGGFNSFTAFNGNPLVLITIACLIISGGLGFIVWQDIGSYRHSRQLMLHSRVVIKVTLFLIFSGMLFFLLMEFNNPLTMGALSLPEKLNAAFFHSVTTRTAGFNSLPLNEMTNMSKVGTVLLMFIGGAPGSTAGGVKVTTFALLLLAVLSQFRGHDEVIVSKNRIPTHVILKAMTIIFMAIVLVGTVTFLLMYFDAHNGFINNLYETTSAFGTVGLSAAGTPGLSVPGRLLITLTMFLGKVGPLSFVVAVSMRSARKPKNLVYPEGKIIVG